MRKLLKFLKPYTKESILGPLFKWIEVLFELCVPLVMANMIDQGIARRNMPYVGKMFLLLVLLAVFGFLASITAQYFAAKAATGFTRDLKHHFYAHIQNLSISQLDEIGSASLVNRMTNDMNQLQSGVNMTLRLVLRSPFVVLGAMCMAFSISVKIAGIFLITIPILSLIVYVIMKMTIPMYRKVQEKLDILLLHTRENLIGMRVLRAFCKEEEEIQHFLDKNQSLTNWQKKVGRISGMLNPLTFMVVNLAIAILIWQGAVEVSIGNLTQGEVIALYNYMSQILVELIKFANLLVLLTKCTASGDRVQAVLDYAPAMKEEIKETSIAKNESGNMVEFRQVTFQYHENAAPALQNISFQIKTGEMVGIIGATGSGKSSLVHLLLRFYDVKKGEIWMDGKNIAAYSLRTLRDKIALCPQKAVVFQGSLRENLLWGNPEATEDEMWRALEDAQIKELVEGKPDGLDFYIEQGGKNLSGGQKQRITIARALLQKAKILILDDSASALDYVTEAKLRKALEKRKGTQTIIMVSQRTLSIQHADQILVLDDGNLVAHGTHDALLESCEVYQEIVQVQKGA